MYLNGSLDHSHLSEDNGAATTVNSGQDLGDLTPPPSHHMQVPATSPLSPAMDPLSEERARQLEAKREAIRLHPDFVMVRRRFYYLDESDIFKGFVKGKGQLRDITLWLSENYNKQAILAQSVDDREKQNQAQRDLMQRQNQESMMAEYNMRQEALASDAAQPQPQNAAQIVVDDADNSPIKMRGKARVKPLASPVAPRVHIEAVPSTKVEVGRLKLSILDKYKFKPTQTIASFDGGEINGAEKRRKLVRGSEASRLPSLNSPITFSNSPGGGPIPASTTFAPESQPLEELELLEKRIRDNQRAKRGSRALGPQLVESDQGDDEDEDMLAESSDSDGMSDEEDNVAFSSGLTSIDGQIVEFINNASAQDICEICQVKPDEADLVMEARPFANIYAIAEFDVEHKPSKRRKSKGMRIVESTEFRLKGYRAVDSLIKTCSAHSDTILLQMKAWGVTVTGQGELDMVDLDPEDDNKVEIASEDEGNIDDDDVVEVKLAPKRGIRYIKHQPTLLSKEITLNNYQQVGINWLNMMYRHKLSCILADEMGLGKTCQVIAFMAHLKQTESGNGRHLVVVPASTIENWLREFQKFCPDLRVQAYFGSQKEREDLRYSLADSDYDVMVTTYSMAAGAKPDFKFLRQQAFDIIVYDEGHLLKNSMSDRYTKLMRLSAKFRLLLTGTPLQNNLKELVSLLLFIMPKLFDEKREDLEALFNQKSQTTTNAADYNPLLAQQAISKAKTMMTPFVLRRRKEMVLQHLPAKIHEVAYCDLDPVQRELYDKYFNAAKAARAERQRRKLLKGKALAEANKEKIVESSSNVVMSLRKAALHPMLFRLQYDDKLLRKMAKGIMNEPEYAEANEQYIFEDMQVMSDFEIRRLCETYPHTMRKYKIDEKCFEQSAKVQELNNLLKTIVDGRGEKVLIFSLFTQVLDILERCLSIRNYKFVRLDGGTPVETRQDIIDQFYEDETIPVFLLSTKAGGFGINLVAANNVIIFDQSFNPHDDKQAEDRAHRVGQKKEVTVHKIIARGTVEEKILQIARNKLELDVSISADTEGGANAKVDEKTDNFFEMLLSS